ncbi:hypothetical protein C2E19_21195 [Pseudomonas sp. DTU12.3]|nr:hypothetical protein C2E19_21195 [Pseudomonas sp. DTU12.3]
MRLLPERFGKLGGGRVQWACHCGETSRNELKGVVSGIFADGWHTFVRQLGAMLPVLPSSRAGSLPQGNAFENVGASLLAKRPAQTPQNLL